MAAFSNFFANVVTDTAGLLDKVFIIGGGFGGEASTTCDFEADFAFGPSSTSICTSFTVPSSLTSSFTFSSIGGGSGEGGGGISTACSFLSSAAFLVFVEATGASPFSKSTCRSSDKLWSDSFFTLGHFSFFIPVFFLKFAAGFARGLETISISSVSPSVDVFFTTSRCSLSNLKQESRPSFWAMFSTPSREDKGVPVWTE
mmetsp:Transcript_5140/g.9409  ORF Transcript_5140/g.9409 Transcript_5140/m.9409 type:complete len:201 (+) Transcript_5140:114-716(+)